MWKKEIRLAGSGGQGLGLAAMVLADAALRAGLQVSTLQSYGPEARGGASRSDVTLCDQDIANPWFSKPAVLLALNEKAWMKYGPELAEDDLALVDSDWVKLPERRTVYQIPLERIAKTEMREKLAANMVAVGALAAAIGRIPLNVLMEAARSRAPKGFARINQDAIRRGWELMEDLKGGVDRGGARGA